MRIAVVKRRRLLSGQPQFAEMCPWEKLKDSEWEELLAKQPQLAGFRR
jgi:hypothetical protein